MNYLDELFANMYLLVFIAIVIPFLISLRMFLIIIYSVRIKNLMDDPVDRSMHERTTPTLGGVGIFITFSISLIVLGIVAPLIREDLIKLLSIIVVCITLLFLGVKDDMIGFSPVKKLIVQIFTGSIIVSTTDLRIASLEGIFGVYEIPFVLSIILTVFVFTFIINCFNLIDGIDGLSGSIAILICISFGTFFCLNHDYLMVLVSMVLIGSILGFLRFNLSKTNKIFMGDSGTMFIGFLLPYIAFSFLIMNSKENIGVTIPNGIIFTLAVLSFPILDALRVFIVRIKAKRSPFSADKNHIHHRLINIGLTHRQAVLCIVLTNSFIIAISLSIQGLNINIQLLILIILSSSLYLVPFMPVCERKIIKIKNEE
ncbi:undecaprenyl/decaprenyl-phosphate alpha-N-acetylglucosaminyl 1-phosphate transferase [Cellulophaga sp. HaHaR_3_176]|uniref:glycosyltransferase family 4 protein n=1 Tax=Cellulophaga sp. HaHaR_3_176 TaxID=1942464 RepID=UPI001C1FD052|nr:MraY family glycosyltransferase [Cellulophaga sp. HaHaR_3_176]QWX84354.1 undecaprenyl/decaprenyl-phosphate alpha-N-acetylglucosaminyl 1-phosphate transferase [Cellulophaga sp. HaHaR_3_176]